MYFLAINTFAMHLSWSILQDPRRRIASGATNPLALRSVAVGVANPAIDMMRVPRAAATVVCIVWYTNERTIYG